MVEKVEEKKEESKKKNRFLYWLLLFIILILILIIIWLLWKYKDDYSQKNLTGNVEIFSIDCDCIQTIPATGDDTIDKEDPSRSGNGSVSKGNSSTSSSEDESSDSGNLVISDSDIVWTSSNQLKIFKNPVYEMEEVIAPGDTNSYHFVIKNNGGCHLKYQLMFEEENLYHINMKYRLKKNDRYIQSSWVSYDELTNKEYSLEKGKQDDYILEWKWVESDNDTKVGSTVGSYYRLKLEILGKRDI